MRDQGIHILGSGETLSWDADKVNLEIDLQLMHFRIEERATGNVLWVMDMEVIQKASKLMETLLFHHHAIERAKRDAYIGHVAEDRKDDTNE